MKVLCTGGSGQLGLSLKAAFQNVEDVLLYLPSREELNLIDKSSIERYLAKNHFDFLVLSGAYTQVDLAEDHRDEAFLINADSCEVFRNYAQQNNIPMIYISTDYVYNNLQSGASIETDLLDPQNIYGQSKLKGEEAVLPYSQSYILRTSWLYSEYGHNFLKTMLKLSESRSELSVVNDQIGTPTYAGHLAELIKQIITKINTPEALAFGIYNYSDEGIATWYDFAHYIFETTNRDVNLTPVSSAQFPTKAKRPANSLMSKNKIRTWQEHHLSHWHLGVKRCIKKLNDEKF